MSHKIPCTQTDSLQNHSKPSQKPSHPHKSKISPIPHKSPHSPGLLTPETPSKNASDPVEVISNDPWSEEEEQKLLQLHDEWGNRWMDIGETLKRYQ